MTDDLSSVSLVMSPGPFLWIDVLFGIVNMKIDVEIFVLCCKEDIDGFSFNSGDVIEVIVD